MNEVYRTLRERLDGKVQFLPDKPEETVDSTLRALWLTAAGTPMSAEAAVETAELPALDTSARAMLDSLVDQRLAGIPLAHITGRQRFLDMEMLAGHEALVPRKETELLARIAIEARTGPRSRARRRSPESMSAPAAATSRSRLPSTCRPRACSAPISATKRSRSPSATPRILASPSA